jgi:hypothetical protein
MPLGNIKFEPFNMWLSHLSACLPSQAATTYEEAGEVGGFFRLGHRCVDCGFVCHRFGGVFVDGCLVRVVGSPSEG